jgi:heme exporter protein A
MEGHRAGGGLVIAATHQSLGLAGASELRIEASAAAPVADVPEDWA